MCAPVPPAADPKASLRAAPPTGHDLPTTRQSQRAGTVDRYLLFCLSLFIIVCDLASMREEGVPGGS